MEDAGPSREGWIPTIGPDLPLSRVIDLAFDYRGNTTVVKRDGSAIEGYVFNRNAEVAEPFLEMFDAQGNGPFAIPYADVETIHFTGKDPAAGNSYAAWLRRKAEAKRPAGPP
jgi:hypothetical protein